MGRNFLSTTGVQKSFGFSYKPEELDTLAKTMYPEYMLRGSKNTHILFPGYPLSILDIHQRIGGKNPRLFRRDDIVEFGHEKFACKARVNLRWHLVRKEGVDGTSGRSYGHQFELVGDMEYVPRACEMIYLLTAYYLVTGVRLYRDHYANTDDFTRFGRQISVGFIGRFGLIIDNEVLKALHPSGTLLTTAWKPCRCGG
jgi:hypothetical protein